MKTLSKVVIPAIVLIIFITTLSGCSLFSRRYEKTYSKEAGVNTTGKQKIIFENVTGDVRIHKSDDANSMTVKAKTTVHLKKSELENDIEWVKLVLDTTGNEVIISIEIVKDRKQFFNFNFNDEYSRTSVDIYVPEKILVDISLTNGDITAKRISNDVILDVTNGDVNLDEYSGKANIDIVNGKLAGELDSTKGITADIVNGLVNLSIGEFFAAKMILETTNGKIKIDKGLPFKESTNEKNIVTGTFGNSDTEVKIDITNGKINLKKK